MEQIQEALTVMREQKSKSNDQFKQLMTKKSSLQKEIYDVNKQLKVTESKIKESQRKNKILTELKKA